MKGGIINSITRLHPVGYLSWVSATFTLQRHRLSGHIEIKIFDRSNAMLIPRLTGWCEQRHSANDKFSFSSSIIMCHSGNLSPHFV
jgi:hypothetical protein